MPAISRTTRPGSWRSATRHTRQYTTLSSRSYGSTIEPGYRIMEIESCTRMETRTTGGVSATVVVDETTDQREYTYGWFKETPLNLNGVPMTFFCTVPESPSYGRDEPEVQLHFRQIIRTVRRPSHRSDPHRYFELVLRVPHQVFDPIAGVWADRWQVIGRTRPIPVPLPLRFQTAVQQMEIINGRQCLITFFYYTRDIAPPMVSGHMKDSANRQPQQTSQQSHAQLSGGQWLGNFDSMEANSPSALDDDMERIIAGIRDIL